MWVVASRLMAHLTANSLNETNQSAYWKYHSLKTALNCVLYDILLAMDQRKSVFLVLLDLSVAFNPIDPQLLHEHLAGRVGVDGVSLGWI